MLGDSTEIEQVQGQRSSRALCQSAVGALCLCAGQLMITLDSGAVKAMPMFGLALTASDFRVGAGEDVTLLKKDESLISPNKNL